MNLRVKNKSVPELGVKIDRFDDWYDLIWELCEVLEWLSIVEGHPAPEAIQVEQKFGALRFYTDGPTKQMLYLILDSESRSETIFEICGAQGERLSYGI